MVIQSGLQRWAWKSLRRLLGRFEVMIAAAISFALLPFLVVPAHAEQQMSSSGVVTAPDLAASSLRMGHIQDLVPQWEHQCISLNEEEAVTTEQAALKQAVNELGRSNLGGWLIDQAAYRSVLICLDGETDLEAYYRAHLHLIGLNARLSPAGRLVFLAHELAHVPQHPRFSNNRRFSPKDMLLLHRMREATAEAIATRVLWQLRDLGYETPWQAKLKTAYGDIADRFEVSLSQANGEAAELLATRAAFYHWFEADWRLEIYDDLMLKTLARIADDHIGLLPSSRWLSDDYLRDLSRYASETFLIEGDGGTLMGAFGQSWLASGKQATLDLILDRARFGRIEPASAHPAPANAPPAIEEEAGLSASSSGPARIAPAH